MANGDSPGFKLFGKTIQADDDKPESVATSSGDHHEEQQQTAAATTAAESRSAGSTAAGGARALACPRCKSKETKFCYFNNYNVNQPRHFCKACHRYWTAGGTLRNVPIGAGRRKNRTPAPQPVAAAAPRAEEVIARWIRS